jgi:hypothetical protein
MSAPENELFAQIVLAKKFCAPEQIRRCLEIQAGTNERLSLGNSLLREGFITRDQHSEVLKALRQGYKGKDAGTTKRQAREDQLFGMLAVREGLVTEAMINECLWAEPAGSPRRSLGEMMVSRGSLRPAQVKELLKKLSKRVMSCSVCKASFNVLSISESKGVPCPRCGRSLDEGKRDDASVAGAFATQACLKALSATVPPTRPRSS